MIRLPSARARAGFTLIELLVVIAIIAILVSLTIAGVMRFMAKGPDLLDVQDIQELSKAIESFKKDMKTYPPDVVVLYPTYADYFKNWNGNPDLDADSLYFLSRMWPNMGPNWGGAYINWSDPNNSAGFPSQGVILQGPQALVYFLAGPQQQGFATNPKHPIVNVVNTDRRKWFPFNQGRLQGSPFPVYVSNHNTNMPFMYFAPGKGGYNQLNNKPYPAAHAVTITNYQNAVDVVSPYYQNVGGNAKYWNPSTFQIITAGIDGCYGSLGEYDDGSSPAPTLTWKDNRSNFSTALLGANVQ